MCGVPVASLATSQPGQVQALIGSIRAAGRRPMLMGASARDLIDFGGTPEQIVNLATSEEPQELTQLPTSLLPVRYEVWITAPVAPGTGT
jgi:hypothetical protein